MSLREDLDAALRSWVEALSPHTRRAYERGIVQFAEYLVDEGVIESPVSLAPSQDAPHAPAKRSAAARRADLVSVAGAYLFSRTAGEANAIVQAYAEQLSGVDEGTGVPLYTRETVKQRLSAIRWAVREARRRGHVTWTLDVVVPRPKKDPETGRVRRKAGRDMRGPSPTELSAMLEAAEKRARGKDGDRGRWLLIVSLIAHETLREHEIVALDRDDVHMGKKTLTVVRKKDEEPTILPLSGRTISALRRWLRVRGTRPGPLLWGSRVVGGRPRAVPGTRITVDGIYYVVHTLGTSCGVPTAPHKVRHTAITVGQAVRERLGIPLHDAMRRSGHRSIEAHERYLDPDLDNIRRLSDGVAEALRGAR